LLLLTPCNDLAIFEDHGQVLAILQHPNVGERIGREHQEVGQLSGGQHPDLVVQP
jgi:hypothetical protein